MRRNRKARCRRRLRFLGHGHWRIGRAAPIARSDHAQTGLDRRRGGAWFGVRPAAGRRAHPPLAGIRLRSGPARERPTEPGAVRHRAGRRLVHRRRHQRLRARRAQLWPRPGRLRLGRVRSFAPRARRTRVARATRRAHGRPAFRRCALHPLRLARRAAAARAPRSVARLEPDPRRGAAPQKARRLPHHDFQHRRPAAIPGPARFRPSQGAHCPHRQHSGVRLVPIPRTALRPS